MNNRSAKAQPHQPAGVEVAGLSLGGKLMTLANLMRRITASRFQRLFEISLVEGWIVSHLGVGGPMSLDALAARCGLAKSQMSRGVSDMVRRKLVQRRRNPNNRNEVILTLTSDGREIFTQIKKLWPRYNTLLLAGLSASDTATLTRIVDPMIENSRRNLEDERLLSGVEEES